MKFLFFLLIISNISFARPIRGTYEVPISGELSKFASYDVKFKSNNYQTLPSTLSFPLPEELTGVPLSITMDRLGNSHVWKGENGEGTCAIEGRYLKCTMHFQDLSFDPVKLSAILTNSYPDSTERNAKALIAEKFQSEPVGILIYKLRGRDAPRDLIFQFYR